MKTMNLMQVKKMLWNIADEIISDEDRLGEIDRKIGDGDHGIGMSNGAKAIQEILSDIDVEDETAGSLFIKAGNAMMESMGGASGVLFSSVFIGIGKENIDKTALTVQGLSTGLSKAVADIQKRGKAHLGDKTMLDALIPASESIRNATSDDFATVMEKAVKFSYDGVENTKKYKAKFGRAKFLGDRAIGFQDAGATSVYLILKAMYESVKSDSFPMNN